jgi:hypothetical protein
VLPVLAEPWPELLLSAETGALNQCACRLARAGRGRGRAERCAGGCRMGDLLRLGRALRDASCPWIGLSPPVVSKVPSLLSA